MKQKVYKIFIAKYALFINVCAQEWFKTVKECKRYKIPYSITESVTGDFLFKYLDIND